MTQETNLNAQCVTRHNKSKHGVTDGYSFAGNENLEYSCDVCFKEFTRKDELKRHSVIHKSLNAKRFECSLCGKSFVRNYTLQEHINLLHSHTGTCYTCCQCGKRFLKKYNLKRHIETLHRTDL